MVLIVSIAAFYLQLMYDRWPLFCYIWWCAFSCCYFLFDGVGSPDVVEYSSAGVPAIFDQKLTPHVIFGQKLTPHAIFDQKLTPMLYLARSWHHILYLARSWHPMLYLTRSWHPMLYLAISWHPILYLARSWHPILYLFSHVYTSLCLIHVFALWSTANVMVDH